MTISQTLYSSEKDDWETPDSLFLDLHDEFRFTLDVCAHKQNKKLDKYFSIETDGLKQSWQGERCWMNPPYGRQIYKWIEKAYEENKKGDCRIVALLPARTDTKWFHEFIYNQHQTEFLKGRLKFKGAKNSAPFPSMLVYFI